MEGFATIFNVTIYCITLHLRYMWGLWLWPWSAISSSCFTLQCLQKQSPGCVLSSHQGCSVRKGVSCEFCEVFKSTFHHRIPLVAASVCKKDILKHFSNFTGKHLFNKLPLAFLYFQLIRRLIINLYY